MATKKIQYVKRILEYIPSDWLHLTTHRLDIYNEALAKTEFLNAFEKLFLQNTTSTQALKNLPTAFDYIRLGHPLSCILEWIVAAINNQKPENVISFSSATMPILAILRKNLLDKRKTKIYYSGALPAAFNANTIRKVYGYNFEIKQVNSPEEVSTFDGSTIFFTSQETLFNTKLNTQIDFYISAHAQLGSIIIANGTKNEQYVSEIQHVRRRESIAMTPANTFTALNLLVANNIETPKGIETKHKTAVQQQIQQITGATVKPVVASSGLSIQYAIVMGLIAYAQAQHPGKAIKIVVPPNCYGGTNDQARRVTACNTNVEVLDLPVDGANNMVQSTDKVLNQIAEMDAIPFIIAEIPTNPRVEVPNLTDLKNVLNQKRTTKNGNTAIAPVFILDQTFCPNVYFLKDENILASVKTISYVSGSKFPSGGKCTAGYCTANKKAADLIAYIDEHLLLCDNEATRLQYELLAQQMPSMLQRIENAYINTREFVQFIHNTLPEAKINFVTDEIAEQGFKPSVFSLDLPTKGATEEERETHKRNLNQLLITRMITEIPNESKYCVSYGQLKGCYWTIPATSTQGTTKEADKDYIARVALSGNMDLERHKAVFSAFVKANF